MLEARRVLLSVPGRPLYMKVADHFHFRYCLKLPNYSKCCYKKEECWKFFSCCNHEECFPLRSSPVRKSPAFIRQSFPLGTAATSHLAQLHPVKPFSCSTDLTTGVSPALHALQIPGFVGCFPCFERAESSSEPVKQTHPVPLGRKCSHVPYLLLFIGVTSLPVGFQVVFPR